MKKLVWLLLLTVLLWSPSGYAAIPKLINYQGRFSDSQGKPITATKKMAFRIYDASGGGTLLWESIYDPSLQQSRGVTIERGVFNEKLGEFNNGNGQYKELKDVPFDKQYYLEIVMEGEVLSPRQLLTSSAYAIRANVADEALQAQNATKVNNIEASTTPQANKILPLDANAKLPITTLKVYDSGWFAVTTSTTYTKTHNLGTTKVIIKTFVSTNSDGSGMCISGESQEAYSDLCETFQSTMVALSTTTITIRTGGNALYKIFDADGNLQQPTSGYYRIIMLALE